MHDHGSSEINDHWKTKITSVYDNLAFTISCVVFLYMYVFILMLLLSSASKNNRTNPGCQIQ